MEKNKFSFDLDDYDDEIFNDYTEVVDESLELDNTEDYNDFNNIIEVEDSNDIDNNDNDTESIEYEEKEIYNFYLSIVYTWFTRIGIGIAVILMAMFITKGDFVGFFKYILLLVGSFFIGYFVMFLFDKFKTNN